MNETKGLKVMKEQTAGFFAVALFSVVLVGGILALGGGVQVSVAFDATILVWLVIIALVVGAFCFMFWFALHAVSQVAQSANTQMSAVARCAIEINAQSARLIEERVSQGVRLWQVNGREMLEVPGLPGFIDARRDAQMSQGEIDFFLQEQQEFIEADYRLLS